MLFNSLSFLIIFLPVCLASYYTLGRLGKNWAAAILVGFSLLFYSWLNPMLIFLLCGSIAYNYLFGLALMRTEARPKVQGWILAAAITGNLLLLFYYKYFYPLADWLDIIGLHISRNQNSILLPLGISFFTFTQIGYLVDCRAGIAKSTKLLDYMLFVTFFPHLIAGPILHHKEMMPQFADPQTYRFKIGNFALGFSIFIMGLAKKVLIADHLAPLASAAFTNPVAMPAIAAWGGAFSYVLQLYFDFSGYCEMAMGLALLFGIRFPANFNSPYKASCIIDYWQRWHMTLTRYLTLYLYNPLALYITRLRQKYGKPIAQQGAATIGGFFSMIAMPTFFTMVLAGVWHGAGIQFLIFGLLHAIYLTINHAWRVWGPKKPKIPNKTFDFFNLLWKSSLTMLGVVIADVFFRAPNVAAALELLKNMIGYHGKIIMGSFSVSPDIIETFLIEHHHDIRPFLERTHFGAPLTLLVVILWVLAMPNVLELTADYKPTLTKISHTFWRPVAWRPSAAWAVILGVMAAVAVLAVTGTTEFLYFQF